MNQVDILNWISQVAHNPYAQVALAAIIVGLAPNSLLVKIPVVGSIVQAWIDAWALKKLKDFDAQREIIERESDRIVRDKEQAIKTGRIDQVSAKAQATGELKYTFDLPTQLASRMVEASVNRINQQRGAELLSGELLSYNPVPDEAMN